jgi:predicted RNase H-like HicB family nuclease
MLTKYIDAAMRRAEYEVVEDDGSIYGHAPDLPGAWANAPTQEACAIELREVVEDWIMLSIADRETLPVINGIDLNVHAEVG